MGGLRTLAEKGFIGAGHVEKEAGEEVPSWGMLWFRQKLQEGQERLVERMNRNGENAPRHDVGETREEHAGQVARQVLKHGVWIPPEGSQRRQGEYPQFWEDTAEMAADIIVAAEKYEAKQERQQPAPERGGEVELPKRGGAKEPVRDTAPAVAQWTAQGF